MHQSLSKLVNRRLPTVLLGIALSCALAGCSHFHVKPSETYVYVTAKQTYLRDRVAAVSNRTGTTTNGEQLVVLDHARRWVKVRTPRGETGWIEERLTVPQQIADKFAEVFPNPATIHDFLVDPDKAAAYVESVTAAH